MLGSKQGGLGVLERVASELTNAANDFLEPGAARILKPVDNIIVGCGNEGERKMSCR